MDSNFKIISHPADTGIEVEADDLGGIFSAALSGFNATVFEKPKELEVKEEREIKAEGQDVKELLVNFLTEVLILLDSERFVAKKVDFVEFPDKVGALQSGGQAGAPTLTIKAVLKGGKVDLDKMGFLTEIKAVTYHRLEVKKTEKGWFARVIFDI